MQAKPKQTFSNGIYIGFGLFSAFQVLAILFSIFYNRTFNLSTDVVNIFLVLFFSYVAWAFFTKQHYIRKLSIITGFLMLAIVLLNLFAGIYTARGLVAGIIYIYFGIKGSVSFIYSGKEFKKSSLINYGLLILFIVGLIFLIRAFINSL